MTLRLILKTSAERDLRAIDRPQRLRIMKAIDRYVAGGTVDLKS